jgi:hypothetical protein
MVFTQETTEAVKEGKRYTTLYKSKRVKQNDTSRATVLNPFLRFNFRISKWQCIFCKGSGSWKEMRYHTHKKHLPEAFGIRLKKEIPMVARKHKALIKKIGHHIKRRKP